MSKTLKINLIMLGTVGLVLSGFLYTSHTSNVKAAASETYGVSVSDTGVLSGYAWGSDVVGWIDFSGVKLSTPISISLNANPTDVLLGNPISTISWSSTGADSCYITKNGTDWVGTSGSTGNTSGSKSSGNLTATTTVFIIHCSNDINSTTDSVTVNLTANHPPKEDCVGYDYVWSPEICPASGERTGEATEKSIVCPDEVKYDTQSCTPGTYSCTDYTYSDWSSCNTDGLQTREILSSFPTNCSGGVLPVLEQGCSLPDTPNSPGSVCTITQGVNNNGKIYVNRSAIWTMRNSLGVPSADTKWSGTNITGTLSGNPLSKIYTTVGPKTITASTTITRADGTKFTSYCRATTTVRLDTGTGGEI